MGATGSLMAIIGGSVKTTRTLNVAVLWVRLGEFRVSRFVDDKSKVELLVISACDSVEFSPKVPSPFYGFIVFRHSLTPQILG